MKYILSFIVLFSLNGCLLRDNPIDYQKSVNDYRNAANSAIKENVSLKDKEKSYRNMITEGEIGLRNVMEEEKEQEIANARKTALYCSLVAILGFVAGCVLLYLQSTTFAMICFVSSIGLFIGCIAYATVIQYLGNYVSSVFALCILGFLTWEAWKHKAAGIAMAHELIPITDNSAQITTKIPIPAVQKVIARLKSKAQRKLNDGLKVVEKSTQVPPAA